LDEETDDEECPFAKYTPEERSEAYTRVKDTFRLLLLQLQDPYKRF
jgi:hypothetical protein